MARTDLKKLNRKQLLELLLRQTERVEELERQLEAAERELEDRTITHQELGSIAEAALKLNGVFEAAEAAAAQYLDNVRMIADNPEKEEEKLELLARQKSKDVIIEIEEKCAVREKEAAMKIKMANEKIAEANKKILEAQKVIEKYKNTETHMAVDKSTAKKDDQPKDVLETFFTGIINK